MNGLFMEFEKRSLAWPGTRYKLPGGVHITVGVLGKYMPCVLCIGPLLVAYQ